MSGTQTSTQTQTAPPPSPVSDPPKPATPMTPAAKAQADAEAAAVAAEKSRIAALKAADEEAEAAAKKADEIEAKELGWETVHRSDRDVTERLAMPGGYLLRVAWHLVGDIGFAPLSGSSVVFVPGDAPALYKKGDPVLLHLRDLNRGVDPEKAEMADVIMTPRISDASEVLLRMPDGSVRVLKAK